MTSTEPPDDDIDFRRIFRIHETYILNFITFLDRCIKLVTESSTAIYGEETRDGFIKVRVESRKILTKFETKSKFSTLKNKYLCLFHMISLDDLGNGGG